MADSVCVVQRPAHASAALDLRRHHGAHTYINILHTVRWNLFSEMKGDYVAYVCIGLGINTAYNKICYK